MWKSVLSLLFLSSSLHASVINDENLCDELFKQKNSVTFHEKLKFLRTGLKLRLQKEKYGVPQIFTANIDSTKFIPNPINTNGQHVIFSIGSEKHDEISEREFSKELWEYDRLEMLILEKQDQIRKMARKNSTSECKKAQRKYKFSWDEFQNLQHEKNTLIHAKSAYEHEKAEPIITRAMKNTKLPWILIENSSLENVHKFLGSAYTRHVIIIAHGRDVGEIFDSSEAVYPTNVFEDLSPYIESISLFVCHSDEAIEFYDLKKALTQSSYYSKRYLFSVKPNSIYRQKNIAPLSVFPKFLHDVDRFLFINEEHLINLHHDSPVSSEICSVTSTNFHLEKGTLGLTLNGHFVGALKAPKQDVTIEFPCSYLNTEENRLIFANLQFQSESVFNSDFEVNINTKESVISLKNKKLTHNEHGHLYRVSFR